MDLQRKVHSCTPASVLQQLRQDRLPVAVKACQAMRAIKTSRTDTAEEDCDSRTRNDHRPIATDSDGKRLHAGQPVCSSMHHGHCSGVAFVRHTPHACTEIRKESCRRPADALRKTKLYFAESTRVLAAEYSSALRKARWHLPHVLPLLSSIPSPPNRNIFHLSPVRPRQSL